MSIFDGLKYGRPVFNTDLGPMHPWARIAPDVPDDACPACVGHPGVEYVPGQVDSDGRPATALCSGCRGTGKKRA